MTIRTRLSRWMIAIVCALSVPVALQAEDVAAAENVASPEAVASERAETPSSDAEEMEGYLRILPRVYDFSGNQDYLQRYRSLDADNADWLDETLAVLNEISFIMDGPGTGAPTLELFHTNPFILNDQWDVRWRPGTGTRLELMWHEYQRPLETFLPEPAEDSISYAQRYNNDLDPNQELYRNRRDLTLFAHVEPFAWSDGLAFLRDVEIRYGRHARDGYRQFSWIFGVVEDMAIPFGNNPERWRGRTEEIDQDIDRFSLGATLMLGAGNVTRVRVFGEDFRNRAPVVTNADLALISPAVNMQPRTINFIADSSLLGASFDLEQRLTRRLLLVVDGLTETLEQESVAPLQAQSVYDGKISFDSIGAGLYYDATENVVLEATGRWSKRSNRTPVGTAATEPRPFLIQDRNLSTPFLRTLESKAYAGAATFYLNKTTARLGVSHEDTERELVLPVGSNAIPESLSVYGASSTPTTVWASLSGRRSKAFRWTTRYEYRTASDTWTVSDPATAQKLRATATFANKPGTAGATLAFLWQNASNDDFAFRTDFGTVPHRMDMESTNVALSGYYVVSPRVQLTGGFQQIDRDQEGSLVLTDVRRWRPLVMARVADGDFGYDSSVQVLHAGMVVSASDKLVVVPSILWTRSEGGIVSAVAPVRAVTLVDNDALTFAFTSGYRISPRGQLNFRYAFNDYDDNAPAGLSGRLQELSLGVTFKF